LAGIHLFALAAGADGIPRLAAAKLFRVCFQALANSAQLVDESWNEVGTAHAK
jgi:hypothetical protein